MTTDKEKYRALSDISLWVLILGNITSIVMAIHQNWEMSTILWVYWAQSVTIGVINVIRIASLKEFSTKNLRMNNRPVPETAAAKRQVATFFALHYGIFHAAYFVFLWQEQSPMEFSEQEFLTLMLLIFSFIAAHGFSYRHNIHSDFKHKKPNLGTLMFYPYMRVIPMHFIIIFGAFAGSTFGIVIFMVMKTIADAGMHAVEHHMFRKKI